MTATVIAQIGDYRITSTLAEGAYGETFVAESQTGQRVAIKRLKLDSILDDKALELFERETNVLKSLAHRGVPHFIDSGVDETGLPYIVQEHIDGQTLEQAVASGVRFDARRAEKLARDLLAALGYLHSMHPPVIHRDIKPANVILAGRGPVIVDYGAVAGRALLHGEATGTVVGTFGYMAPEMLKGQASAASDLYSLGATLLYAFSGREPESFPARRLRIRFRQAIALDERMAKLLEALLEPAAEDRPRSAAEAIDVLDGKPLVRRPLEDEDEDAAGEGGAMVKGGAKTPAQRRATRVKIAAGVSAASLLALFAVLGPAAFVGLLKSIAIGGGILLVLFLIFITFVGGF